MRLTTRPCSWLGSTDQQKQALAVSHAQAITRYRKAPECKAVKHPLKRRAQHHNTLTRPIHFNFAEDVLDHGADRSPRAPVIYRVSQELDEERISAGTRTAQP